MRPHLRFGRRCWVGLIVVVGMTMTFLAVTSRNANHERPKPWVERKATEAQAHFGHGDMLNPAAARNEAAVLKAEATKPGDSKTFRRTPPEELATGLGLEASAGLTLAPSISPPPDIWTDRLLPATSIAAAKWGKLRIGRVTVSYPSRLAQMKDFLYRLRARYAGIRLPAGSRVSLNTAITLHVNAQVPRPNAFTVYYSPGLDGEFTLIAPITKTNSSQVKMIPAPLRVLLASNGFSVVHLKRDVIKVFPTSMARIYANAPIDETTYPK
jgi:hypothetical protein